LTYDILPGRLGSRTANSRRLPAEAINGRRSASSDAINRQVLIHAPQGSDALTPATDFLDSPKSPEYCSPSPRCRAPKFPHGNRFSIQSQGDHMRPVLAAVLRKSNNCRPEAAESHAQASDSQRRACPEPAEGISALITQHTERIWADRENKATRVPHFSRSLREVGCSALRTTTAASSPD
jgi:hypothetical protein